MNHLKSYKNAYRVIRQMEKDKLLNSVKRDRKVYFLSNKGMELIGRYTDTNHRGNYEHYLMRNDLFIFLERPRDWQTEFPIEFGSKRLIPDAIFRDKEGRFTFVEIDYMQSWRNNRDKISLYSDLSATIQRDYGHTPSLIYYTATPGRKKRLEKEFKKYSSFQAITYSSPLPSL